MNVGAAAGLRPAVFLDRDGVLNRSVVRDGKPYPPAGLAELELLPGVAEACARLEDAGFVVVVVTNQPDVGRGTQRREAVEAMHAALLAAVPGIARIEVCYHAGSEHGEACDCRKPLPGMFRRAAEALGLDLAGSFCVGDRWRDVDAGRAAGCRTIFIDLGYAETLRTEPDFRARDLPHAAEIILGNLQRPC